jgi:hypothetical protein
VICVELLSDDSFPFWRYIHFFAFFTLEPFARLTAALCERKFGDH